MVSPYEVLQCLIPGLCFDKIVIHHRCEVDGFSYVIRGFYGVGFPCRISCYSIRGSDDKTIFLGDRGYWESSVMGNTIVFSEKAGGCRFDNLEQLVNCFVVAWLSGSNPYTVFGRG
jgi:hypothetical protein